MDVKGGKIFFSFQVWGEVLFLQTTREASIFTPKKNNWLPFFKFDINIITSVVQVILQRILQVASKYISSNF